MILTTADILAQLPSRIISLVPSQTELLHYLGLEAETIGITKFCVHPQSWYKEKSRVGGTKNIDIDKVRSLSPDLIIANKEENVKDQVEQLAVDFPVWVTDVNTLENACNMIIDIGNLTNKKKAAHDLREEIQRGFLSLEKLVQQQKKRLSVAYLIWNDPFMAAGRGCFIHDMLEKCGFDNVFAGHSRYPEIEMEQLMTSGCDYVLLSSEPYPFNEKHVQALRKKLPGKKICLVDGEMFSWYGSRLLKSISYFGQLVTRLHTL